MEGKKQMHEWEIYEKDLPWWFFWIYPEDNMIFQHYGSVCYGGYEYEDIPKRYRKHARKIIQIK